MKKPLLFLFAFACCATAAVAQTFEWAKSQPINYSLNPDMVSYSAATDAQGNVLTAGLLHYKANLGTSVGMAGNVYLRQYNRNGALLFNQTITGKVVVESITASPDGSFYLAGMFKDSAQFDGTHILTDNSSNSFSFLAKYTGTGQVQWAKKVLTDVPGAREAAALTTDAAGNLYVAFVGTGLNSFIRKYDAAGTQLLNIDQTNVNRLSSIAVDVAGNIYVAGSCVGNGALFAGQSFGTGPTYDLFVASYTPAGAARWVNIVEDVTCEGPEIKADRSGHLYMAGHLNGSFAFGPFTSTGDSWVYDYYLTRLDSDGNFLWLREVPQVTGGDATIGNINYLATDTANNVYLGGLLRNSIDWGNGITNSGAGNMDFLVQKFSPNGSLNWSKTAGGTQREKVSSLAVNSFGDVFIAGTAQGAITLDTIQHTQTGFIYPVLAKISAAAGPVAAADVTENKLQLFPNPTSGTVTFTLPENKDSEVTIYTSLGRLVMRQIVSAGTPEAELSVQHLPAGMYVVQLQSGSHVYRQRLLKH